MNTEQTPSTLRTLGATFLLKSGFLVFFSLLVLLLPAKLHLLVGWVMLLAGLAWGFIAFSVFYSAGRREKRFPGETVNKTRGRVYYDNKGIKSVYDE